jgi:hypothetical protein
MKRIIYMLTAVFSAIAASILIIENITDVNQYASSFFNYRSIDTTVLLALCIFSVIQFKRHTPRIILILCGYVFIASSSVSYGYWGYSYFSTLLFMASALVPAVYEFSHYGTAARQDPKVHEQSRWRWLTKAAIALASCRALPFFLQVIIQININASSGILEYYSTDIMGIAALVCYAIFCGLMDRRTSGLYRAFFTGCIIFDAIQTVFIDYNRFFTNALPDPTAKALFVLFEVIYALFVLLILAHAFLTRRDGLLTQERLDATQRAETPAA